MNVKPPKYELLAKHLFLIAIMIVVLFPVLFVLGASINPTGSLGGDIIPKQFSLANWRYVFGLPYVDPVSGETVVSPYPIMKWLFNSIKVAGIASIVVLLLSTTSAYALSRFRFKGQKSTLVTLMILQMFPAIMAMVAFYVMLDFIGQYFPGLGIDTHGGLILVYLGQTPFYIWLIKGYFDSIPKSLEESAIIDGCTRFQAFYKIVIPLCTPILAVVTLLTFISVFSDFVLPSIILKSEDKLTFAVGIQIFISDQYSGRWGQFAAACILCAAPITALFMSINRFIVAGLAKGGSKG
jgi:maltose/maltodextrin transport system permease protein